MGWGELNRHNKVADELNIPITKLLINSVNSNDELG